MFGKIGIFVLVATMCGAVNLSLEEKVGQMLMPHFLGEVVNEDARLLIQEGKIGNLIYYTWANGLQDPEQVRSLSHGLQALTSSIPLLIATDQEGGVVTRLQKGFTQFPGNRALGETLDPTLARKAALITGKEMRAVGIHMNMAPVVDVNSNPKNPVIGARSFGEDPYLVTVFGRQALQGYAEAGVIATLKHFPGHGDVSVDSHTDLPVIHKSLEELEKCELIPFRGLCQSVDAIMTAHLLVPALDPDNCSTLSSKTLRFLREEMGFRGVIVSDSLVMDGVVKKCHTVDEAAIQALAAGCDLLILGGKLLVGADRRELTAQDVLRIHGAIVEAVRSGRIPAARLDEAVERILALKRRFVDSN
jgi:beta-N-acetylhexosaminidase